MTWTLVEAEAERRGWLQDVAIAAAWHVEAFARQKRLPPLAKMLERRDAKAQPEHDGLALMRQRLEALAMQQKGLKRARDAENQGKDRRHGGTAAVAKGVAGES